MPTSANPYRALLRRLITVLGMAGAMALIGYLLKRAEVNEAAANTPPAGRRHLQQSRNARRRRASSWRSPARMDIWDRRALSSFCCVVITSGLACRDEFAPRHVEVHQEYVGTQAQKLRKRFEEESDDAVARQAFHASSMPRSSRGADSSRRRPPSPTRVPIFDNDSDGIPRRMTWRTEEEDIDSQRRAPPRRYHHPSRPYYENISDYPYECLRARPTPSRPRGTMSLIVPWPKLSHCWRLLAQSRKG